MKKGARQSKKGKQFRYLRFRYVLLRCMAALFPVFLLTVDGMAASPPADYPSRQIEYVTHSAPGSTNDVMGRLMGDIIQKEKILSQPMVVVNKMGSGSAVALGYVFEKKGNPHIVLAVSTALLSLPLREKVPYNYKSFTPIACLVNDGSVLVVRSNSPFKSADDLVAEARRRPKELLQGGGSITSNESILGRSMQKAKGVQWNFISFNGEPETLVSVLNGTVDFAMVSTGLVSEHVRAGKMRVLLSCTPDRYPEFKDVPTVKEAGMGEPVVTYRGLVGAPNIPDYAVKKLETAFKKIMENDRFKKYCGEAAMQPFWKSSNEFGKWLDEENERVKARLNELDSLKK